MSRCSARLDARKIFDNCGATSGARLKPTERLSFSKKKKKIPNPRGQYHRRRRQRVLFQSFEFPEAASLHAFGFPFNLVAASSSDSANLSMTKEDQLSVMDTFSPAHQPDEGYSEDPLNPPPHQSLADSLATLRSPADLSSWLSSNASALPLSVKKGEGNKSSVPTRVLQLLMTSRS